MSDDCECLRRRIEELGDLRNQAVRNAEEWRTTAISLMKERDGLIRETIRLGHEVELRRAELEQCRAELREERDLADIGREVAHTMGTEDGWSVGDHVEQMRELLEEASTCLDPDAEGALELCEEIRNCLAGRAPE